MPRDHFFVSYVLFFFIMANASADARIMVTQPVATTMENGTLDCKSLILLKFNFKVVVRVVTVFLVHQI